MLLVFAVLVAGCAGDERAPERLMDGSEIIAPPVTLEGVDGPKVLTKVRVVPPAERGGTASASCLAHDWDIGPAGPSVERVGVVTESVSFREAANRSVFGCSRSTGPQDDGRLWCGTAYGRLYGGELRDPRLDILCGTSDAPVGFAWVQPSSTTRYVAVRQPGYAEVYEIAGGLPIRIATTNGVRVEGSTATFDLSEHDATGALLRRYRLEPAVAG